MKTIKDLRIHNIPDQQRQDTAVRFFWLIGPCRIWNKVKLSYIGLT